MPKKGWRTIRTWPAVLNKFKFQAPNNYIPTYLKDHSHDPTTTVKMLRKEKVLKDQTRANICIFKRNEKQIQATFYIEPQDNFRWFVSIGN